MIKPCIVCGMKFEIKTNRKCCSPECLKKHHKEFMKEYYKKHKEEISRKNIEYRQIPEIKEHKREYYQKNKEKFSILNKEYNKNHREELLKYWKDYNKNKRIHNPRGNFGTQWSEEEIKLLRELYSDGNKLNKNTFSIYFPKRTWDCITSKASRLKIKQIIRCPLTEETKQKMSIKRLKYYKEHPEYAEKIRQLGIVRRGKHLSEETKRKCSIANKGYHYSPSTELTSERSKKHWANPESKEKHLKAILKSLFKRPTSLEQDFINIIEKHNLPFNYVGNGKLIIDGKNPDFVENNGRKLIIEVRHTKICQFFDKETPEKYKEKRIEYFAKNGWNCIVFFENDLKNEQELLGKINQFIK